MNKNKFSTKYLVEMALLVAIILLMAFTPIGYIKTAGLEITLIVVPVAVGAVTLGPTAGAILGGVFGITSFIQCFGMSTFGVALFSHFYWTFFSVLGSVIGQLLPFQLEGVDFCMTALFVIIFIDKWEHADRHSPALIGLGVGVLCLLIFGQNSFMLPALLLSTALLLLITNTNFGKKKGGKDNDEVKTADEKTEIVTSPEDIITDEKEERKI